MTKGSWKRKNSDESDQNNYYPRLTELFALSRYQLLDLVETDSVKHCKSALVAVCTCNRQQCSELERTLKRLDVAVVFMLQRIGNCLFVVQLKLRIVNSICPVTSSTRPDTVQHASPATAITLLERAGR